MTGRVRKAIQKLTGFHVYRNLPRGADLIADVRQGLPAVAVTTVFDVGANIGQSAIEFREAFPRAKIWSFEPVASTFRELERNVAPLGDVRCFPFALGSQDGTQTMALEGPSTTYRIAEGGAETIEIMRLDSFCEQHGVGRINYLKIDTEGHDLEVLRGGKEMLRSGRVDIVQVEAGLSPLHDWHVTLEVLKAELEAMGMHIFSIGHQMRNFVPGAPYLQWCNALFISDRIARGG